MRETIDATTLTDDSDETIVLEIPRGYATVGDPTDPEEERVLDGRVAFATGCKDPRIAPAATIHPDGSSSANAPANSASVRCRASTGWA